HVEQAVIDAVNTDTAEQQDGWIEHAIRHRQQLDPDPDQRQVEHQQQDVTHPHADDHAPERFGPLGYHLRAGHDAVDHHRADHQRHHRIRRQAHDQQRNEGSLGAGIVGRLRPGNPFDGALAEARRVLGQAFLDHVGGEGAEHRPAAGQYPQDRAQTGAPGDRLPGTPVVVTAGQYAAHLADTDLAGFIALEIGDDLANAEDAHGDDHEADAVGQLRQTEGK